MAGSLSVINLFRQTEGQIAGRLSAIDPDSLDVSERRLLRELKRLTTDIRLDLRDYEYADTRDELAGHATNARRRLHRLGEAILRAGEAGVFGAADVAQLSAGLDDINDRLRA